MNLPVLRDWAREVIDAPDGRKITVISKDGGLFADEPIWFDGLHAPSCERAGLSGLVSTHGALMNGKPGFVAVAQVNGTPVYRWDVIDEALMFWYTEYVRAKTPSSGKVYRSPYERDQCEKFAATLKDMRFHFRRQQEARWVAKLTGRTEVDSPSTMPVWADRVMKRLGEAVVEHDERLAEHDGKIESQVRAVARLEAVVLRLRDEWITVKEGARECCVDESTIVYGRENLGSAAGRILKKNARPEGPKRTTRLDGNGLMTPVNTWMRSDVYKVFKHLTGRDFDHLLVD